MWVCYAVRACTWCVVDHSAFNRCGFDVITYFCYQLKWILNILWFSVSVLHLRSSIGRWQRWCLWRKKKQQQPQRWDSTAYGSIVLLACASFFFFSSFTLNQITIEHRHIGPNREPWCNRTLSSSNRFHKRTVFGSKLHWRGEPDWEARRTSDFLSIIFIERKFHSFQLIIMRGDELRIKLKMVFRSFCQRTI